MLDRERYSSKTCLNFHGLDASDPWDAVFKVINNQMGIPINDVDLAACRFLPGAGRRPITVKFSYHHRDLIWYYEDIWKKLRNSAGKSIYKVERLTPTDRGSGARQGCSSVHDNKKVNF